MNRLQSIVIICSAAALITAYYINTVLKQKYQTESIDIRHSDSSTTKSQSNPIDVTVAEYSPDNAINPNHNHVDATSTPVWCTDSHTMSLHTILQRLQQPSLHTPDQLYSSLAQLQQHCNQVDHQIIDIALSENQSVLQYILHNITDTTLMVPLKHISASLLNTLCTVSKQNTFFIQWLNQHYTLDARLSLIHYSDLHHMLLHATQSPASTKHQSPQSDIDSSLLDLINLLFQLRPISSEHTNSEFSAAADSATQYIEKQLNKLPWIMSYQLHSKQADTIVLPHPIKRMRQYIRDRVDLSEPGLQLIQNDINIIKRAFQPNTDKRNKAINRADVCYHTLRAISTLTQLSGVSDRFIEYGGIELLSIVCRAYSKDIKIQIQTSRLCADLLSSGNNSDGAWLARWNTAIRLYDNNLLPILHDAAFLQRQAQFELNTDTVKGSTHVSLSSQKNKLQHQSIRALTNLQSVTRYYVNSMTAEHALSEPLYSDDVLLVNPFSDRLSDIYNTYVDAVNAFKSHTPQLDIIFIHGLLGNPIGTWRAAIENMPATHINTDDTVSTLQHDVDNRVAADELYNDNDVEIYWPRDWLSNDLPHARIISIGYNSLLSTRFGSPSGEYSSIISKPVQQRARELLVKLEKCHVGNERPIIFVSHSLGGLLCKQMLSQTELSLQYHNIYNNTIGCIFYSVPHFGVWMPGIFNAVYRPSIELAELKAHTPELIKLNDKLYEWWLSNKLGVLSFSETQQTTLPPKSNPNTASKPASTKSAKITSTSTSVIDDDHTVDNADESADDKKLLTSASRLSRLFSSATVSYMLVEQWSSNPSFGLNQTCDNTDHYTICKPYSQIDDKYNMTLQFIRQMIQQHQHKLYESAPILTSHYNDGSWDYS